MDIRQLIESSMKAKENAYAPYSKFRVGAALLAKDGRIYTGCNIENASYGVTNCAERTAIFKAVSEGVKDFISIAINSDSDMFVLPCGVCRQVMAEFSYDMKVYISNRYGEYKEYSLKDLFPVPFTKNDLE